MPSRDSSGRFIPGDQAFVEISNKEIYAEVQDLRDDVNEIKSMLSNFHRMVSLVTPTVTCVAGALTAYYYARH